jgi:hypothetical protein
MFRLICAAACAALLAACSSVPDVEYSYYPAKSNTLATVTQTIDCNNDKSAFVIVNTPAVTTAYAADFDRPPYQINIKDVEGSFSPFADSDANFTFYDDGRLKSINQSTTGQGEAVIKSAVTLGTTIAALGGGAPVKNSLADECAIIASWGASKPVTLTYSLGINLATALGKVSNIPVSPTSAELYDDLNPRGQPPKLPQLQIWISAPSRIGGRAGSFRAAYGSTGAIVELPLQEMMDVKVRITASGATIWSGEVTVPGTGTYTLPIPKAALFGKQSFSLSLAESGAITAVDYGKLSGAAGALNAGNTIAAAVEPESAAAKAADVKAQADLIVQQQRLMKCQRTPATCQ